MTPRFEIRRDYLTWFCDECGELIAPGDGFLIVDDSAARDKLADPESTDRNQVGWRLERDGKLVQWFAYHDDCDQYPDRMIYYLKTSELLTVSDFIFWTSRLVALTWPEVTDWMVLLEEVAVAIGNLSPRPVAALQGHRLFHQHQQ